MGQLKEFDQEVCYQSVKGSGKPDILQNGFSDGDWTDSVAKERSHSTNGHVKSAKTEDAKSASEAKITVGGKQTKQKLTKHGVPWDEHEPCRLWDAIQTYICYAVLVLSGYVNDFIRPRTATEKFRAGYTSLYASFESFYTRHVYRRVRDAWNIPICSVPGGHVVIKDRVSKDHGWTFQFTGVKLDCINMGSYNYLGFAENEGKCAEDSIEALRETGISLGTTRKELGPSFTYLDEFEELVSKFVGSEDCLTCAMGFATNSMNLPCILNDNCLVISDEKNHASIILGLRTSGATVRVFKHNSMKSLEKRLREGIVKGRPKTHLPWDKIFIVVEGVYSMEGTIVNLPEVLRLKNKYKAYLYLDEAHSIGAVGPRGRGVCDYWGISPKEVDIMMGTFTKSFGSAGGYIAGSKQFIDVLRRHSHSETYGACISPPVAAQIVTSMKIIMGEDGSDEGVQRISQLARNARYFRQKLKQLGFVVYGSKDSPVVPVAVYMPTRLAYCVREMRKAGVAIVAVGFPATPLVEGRIRFCMSASHTKEMLDHVIKAFTQVGNDINLRVSKLPRYKGEITYEELEGEVSSASV